MARNDLPAQLPIFPLPNVVLFPNAHLPLHIFEPRYRAMTEDVLSSDRMLGMVLLASVDASEPRPVYPVGCAGKVIQAQRLNDGRFYLILQATQRFRILNEQNSSKPYRIVRPEALADPCFQELPAPKAQELGQLIPHLEDQVLALASLSAPEKSTTIRAKLAELDPVALVNALCFGLDCSMLEKQSLLEASDVVERAQLLSGILNFRQAERRLTEAPQNVN